jgi:hypothetical protein
VPYHNFVGGSTILIGDSHTALTPLVTGTIQYPKYDVNADPGRNSTVAYAMLAQYLRPRHTKVIFDIATNDWADPATFRYNLGRVWNLIGRDRALVLVTSFYPWDIVAPINKAIREFAATKTRVEVCQWSTTVWGNLGLVADALGEGPWPDGIHFTYAGYGTRAGMVKTATRNAQPRLSD